MTLRQLLDRAGIARYTQHIWFRDTTLEKTAIVTDDPALAASLTRCWLPQIRQVLPLCTIRVGTPTAKPTLVKSAYRGQVATPVAGKIEFE